MIRYLCAMLLVVVLCAFEGVAQDQGNDPFAIPGEDYYVEALIEGDDRVYLGEQVVYVFRTYVSLLASTRANLFQDLPDFQGFWQAGVFEPRNQALTVIHGQQYTVLELIVLLHPVRTGVLRIESARLEIFPASANTFENLFREPDTVVTEALEVEVLPLPEQPPPEFYGAVGQLTLDVTLDRLMTRLGEPLTLRVNLTGEGNLPQTPAPRIDVPNGWRVFENQATAELESNVAGLLLWSRDFEFLLVPGVAGTQEIPALRVTYFDPSTETYITLTGPTFTVDVLPGEDGVTALQSVDEGGAVFAPPVREIALRGGQPLGGPPWWAWVLPLVIVAVIGGIQGARQRVVQARRRLRQRRALVRAQSALMELQALPYDEGAYRLRKVLLGYVWDKLGYIPPEESSNIPKILADTALDPRYVTAFLGVLRDVEALPYVPASMRRSLDEAVAQAGRALAVIDRNWEPQS